MRPRICGDIEQPVIDKGVIAKLVTRSGEEELRDVCEGVVSLIGRQCREDGGGRAARACANFEDAQRPTGWECGSHLFDNAANEAVVKLKRRRVLVKSLGRIKRSVGKQ